MSEYNYNLTSYTLSPHVLEEEKKTVKEIVPGLFEFRLK